MAELNTHDGRREDKQNAPKRPLQRDKGKGRRDKDGGDGA